MGNVAVSSGFDFAKGQPCRGMPDLHARGLFPTANGDVDIERVKLDDAGNPAGPLGREDCRSAAAEGVQNDAVPAAAVAGQAR